MGGEAYDEMTGTLYATDGLIIASMTWPGCVPGPVFPAAAWPPGPCGPIGGPPIVAMCDAPGPGTFWALDAAGVVSLLPFPPGPPIAQALAPAPTMAGGPSGITFDPASGLLYFTDFATPVVVGAVPPVGFVCAPLAPVARHLIPPCLPPPFVGVTVNTAIAPGPIPALVVTDGIMTAEVWTGACPCPVLPPAGMPVTDLDFADYSYNYGRGCGCGPPTIGTSGGFAVLGNAGFGLTLNGLSPPPSPAFAALVLSLAPASIPLGAGCFAWLAPPFLVLATVPTTFTGGVACPGSAALPLPIPAGPPALVGAPVYFQWVAAPAIGGIGLEFSDAIEIVIGFP